PLSAGAQSAPGITNAPGAINAAPTATASEATASEHTASERTVPVTAAAEVSTGRPSRPAARPVPAGTPSTPGAVPFDGSIGVQRTEQAPPTAAPVQASTAELATPPHEQVLAALAPIRGSKTGEHQLTVQLHPAELGPVSVVARFEHGELVVTLASSSDAARDALHSALPQRRDNLQQAGFAGVAVSLDAGGGSGQAGREPAFQLPDAPAQPADSPVATRQDAPATRSRTAHVSALDRLL
ncbi:MAG TPA: flagellar hook-length control protein FliK, partial [Mycobacterium sp.]|nr:flagellar hook-length control protein FliK [Mycobacterium sp.]